MQPLRYVLCICMNVVYLLLQSKLMFLSTNFCALGQSHKCILITARLTIADSGLGFSRIFFIHVTFCDFQTFPRPWTVTRFIFTLLPYLEKPLLDSTAKADICAVSVTTSRDYKSILSVCHPPPPPMNEKSIAFWYLLFIFLFVDSSTCMCVGFFVCFLSCTYTQSCTWFALS